MINISAEIGEKIRCRTSLQIRVSQHLSVALCITSKAKQTADGQFWAMIWVLGVELVVTTVNYIYYASCHRAHILYNCHITHRSSMLKPHY